jgi:hypothetical protein
MVGRVVVLALTLIAFQSSAGQQLEKLAVGTRVRVTLIPTQHEIQSTGPRPITGTLVRPAGDTLVLMMGHADTARVSLGNVSRVEYSRARVHPTLKYAIIGALGMATAGYVVGMQRTAADATLCTTASCPQVSTESRHRGAWQGAAIGGGLGVLAGVLASRLTIVDRWGVAWGSP